MKIPSQKRRISPITPWLFVIGLVGIGIYSIVVLRETSAIYDGVIAMEAQIPSGSVAKVSFPDTDKPLNVPNWTLLEDGDLWGVTSRANPLPEGFQAPNLVETSVAHGDSDTSMRVQQRIESPLKKLFDAAEQDGIELMLSSAYRSIDEQQKLYNSFVAAQGAEMADQYVAQPGASEHHTGLSIDFATASGPCEADSDKCSLSQAAANWLVENAPRFGFIQRYPEGKKPLTGVAFEPWHYRYVGIPMALAVSDSGLTFDEAVRQFAPGFLR